MQIIVKKQNTNETPSQDPDFYLSSHLQPYDKSDQLYIAAEVTKDDVVQNKTLTVGDGKTYSTSLSGSKYRNVELQPNSYYFLFQRIFKTKVSYCAILVSSW